jgi:hypothetical protein
MSHVNGATSALSFGPSIVYSLFLIFVHVILLFTTTLSSYAHMSITDAIRFWLVPYLILDYSYLHTKTSIFVFVSEAIHIQIQNWTKYENKYGFGDICPYPIRLHPHKKDYPQWWQGQHQLSKLKKHEAKLLGICFCWLTKETYPHPP